MIKMDCAAFIIPQCHQIDNEYGESEEMAPLSMGKTCMWNVYILLPNFYIVTFIYLFFLFLIQNIHCRRGGSNMYPQCMFCAKILKKTQQIFFPMKFSFFFLLKTKKRVEDELFLLIFYTRSLTSPA